MSRYRTGFCCAECALEYREEVGLGIRRDKVKVGGDRVSWASLHKAMGSCPNCLSRVQAPARIGYNSSESHSERFYGRLAR